MSVASITNVQEWLESTLSQHFAIVCEEPEVVEKSSGGMLGSVLKKPYVTYRIRYKMPGRDSVTVRHRFSEFEQVRSELRDRYHPLGIIVPALPPKHSLNSAMTQQLVGMDLQDGFLKQRSLGLTIFCEVCNHNQRTHMSICYFIKT
ncbi:hypothetical protein EON65_16120 [archaeon]|nr:MAG: hypothetical protein EON65_16120 [archaeon]